MRGWLLETALPGHAGRKADAMGGQPLSAVQHAAVAIGHNSPARRQPVARKAFWDVTLVELT